MLGERRKLLAARQTRSQYKAMNEKIAELEAEVARLNDALSAQQQATAKEGADHAECAEAAAKL